MLSKLLIVTYLNHRAHHVVEIISTLIFDRHWSKTTFLALQMVKFSSLHDERRSSCGLLPPVNVLRMVVLSSISGVESSSPLRPIEATQQCQQMGQRNASGSGGTIVLWMAWASSAILVIV